MFWLYTVTTAVLNVINYLAPYQLLKGIGAVKKSKKKDTLAAYQDSVTAPVDRRFDDDAEGADIDEEDEPEERGSDNNETHHARALGQVTNSICKVCRFQYLCARTVGAEPVLLPTTASAYNQSWQRQPSEMAGLVCRNQDFTDGNGEYVAFSIANADP